MQHSDLSFPEETRIYYGFPTRIVLFFLGALGTGVVAFLGVYFQETGSILPAAMMSTFLIGLGIWELRKRDTLQPQIVLNARGIQVAGYDFAAWNDIKHERVRPSGSASYSLIFENKGREIVFPLFDLKVDVGRLEQMLVFYRKAEHQKK